MNSSPSGNRSRRRTVRSGDASGQTEQDDVSLRQSRVVDGSTEVALQRHDGNGNGLQSVHVKVDNIDRSTQELWQKVDNIEQRLSSFGKPNWQVIISALVVGGALFAFAIQPIKDDLIEIKKNELRRESLIREEFQSLRKTEIVPSAVYANEIAAIRRYLDYLNKEIATARSEYATREQLTSVAKRVDDNSKVVGGLFPLDKVIDQMTRRLDALQLQSTPPSVVVTPPQRQSP